MSPAPKFSTADIAKGAHERKDERLERERQAEQASEVDAATAAAATAGATATDRQLAEDSAAPLFATDAAMGFQHRWDAIQAGFVDDPRRAVEDADALVAETMQKLAETFAGERRRLEQELARRPVADATPEQSSASTEDLRIALRHYRSFFKRLLSV
jgi:hypothetical protein